MESQHDGKGDQPSSTNLIVNYLPQTMTDEEFKKLCLTIGPLKSCKIVRDKTTNYSFGFGFVDYVNSTDAQRAIQALNGLHFQNKQIKVALAKQGEDMDQQANLYIRNVPKTMKDDEFEELFKEYGAIVQSKILIDLQTGESKGVGFVMYHSKAEADKAIAGMNGKTPPGGEQPWVVKYADDASKKASKQMQQHSAITGRQINMGSGQTGPMRNPPGNRMRFNPMGGPIGNMNNTYGGNAGMPPSYNATSGTYNSNYNAGMPYGGNGYDGAYNPGAGGFEASGALPQPSGTGHLAPGGGFIIHAYNIGYDCNESELRDLFRPFGTISRVNVIYDHQRQQCKGFGFVTMTNYREAQNAIISLNGHVYKGRALSVSFKKDKQ